jgi:hypothetical protein
MLDKDEKDEILTQLRKVQAVAVMNYKSIQGILKCVKNLYDEVLPMESLETVDEYKTRKKNEAHLADNQAHLDEACKTINQIADSPQHLEKKI